MDVIFFSPCVCMYQIYLECILWVVLAKINQVCPFNTQGNGNEYPKGVNRMESNLGFIPTFGKMLQCIDREL